MSPVVLIVLAVGGLLGSLALAGSATLYQINEVFVAILFAVAVSYVIGQAGTPAFGNQIFYAAGAYMTAMLSTKLQVGNQLLLLGASLAAALVLGAIISLLLRKMNGVAFGMVTLALGQMAFIYVEQNSWLGGDNGISGIGLGEIFGIQLQSAQSQLIFVWVIVVIGVTLLALLASSRWGLLTRAARDSSSRANAVGLSTFRYHAVAFIVGAALCGVAGSLTATTVGTVDTSMIYWTAGAVPILAGLMGGIRTIRGPILGAIILSFIIIWISTMTTSWLLIEGLVTLGVFLIWPRGLLGEGRGSALGAIAGAWRYARRTIVGAAGKGRGQQT
jgi:branched-chain amino acid transport system permease protein